MVNNAMLIRYDPIEVVDDAILDRMLAIGIKGAVWGVQALLRHMDPGVGGVILNLASPVAERGFPRTAIYSMVKGAMGTFTRTLAAELGPRKVRVNALAPGSIPTPGAVAITPQAEYERRAVTIPLRRHRARRGCDQRVAVPAERCGVLHQRRHPARRRRRPGLGMSNRIYAVRYGHLDRAQRPELSGRR